jgi:DNA-binding NtrC family response regulator
MCASRGDEQGPLREVERGNFREDLVLPPQTSSPSRRPALRERVVDIPILAESFMLAFSRENGTKPKPMGDDDAAGARRAKVAGERAGAEDVVERMAILSGERVTIADLPEDPHESPFGTTTGRPKSPARWRWTSPSPRSPRAPLHPRVRTASTSPCASSGKNPSGSTSWTRSAGRAGHLTHGRAARRRAQRTCT